MSEREYIERLLERAESYIAVVERKGSPHCETVMNWEGAKTSLSAHTMRDLCRMWIERDDLQNSDVSR